MSGRGGVRSSVRLSGDVAATASVGPARTTVAAAPASPGPTVRVAPGRGRPVSTTAAAALRRARAAERAREVEDSPRVLRDKCRRLARALRNAKHLVVYTGAGISTAAQIPDYRGPAGVWTRLARGERVARVEVSRARPTYTHMALSALWARGALKFVVSQNCDGLHLRAGLPRAALAELHGDMFCEVCAPCRRVYVRAFDTTERTARHRHATRRLCHACGAELRDSIVHFGERGRAAWPLNWAGALRHAARADVVLCLGSSLKVLRRYPRLWRMQAAPRARPHLYIVNLQWTPKDAAAKLKINARCDAVMAQVARRLRLRVPRYRAAADPLLAHAEPLAPPEAHTTSRPVLRAPAAASSSDSDEPLSSPSASDSDEELPLRRLADRLRCRPPDRLRAFQVNLESGEATILLRAEHAAGELRRVRGPRAADVKPLNGAAHIDCKLRRLLDYEPRIDASDPPKDSPPDWRDDDHAQPPPAALDTAGPEIDSKMEPKIDMKMEPKIDMKMEPKIDMKMEPKTELKMEPKLESGESSEEESALSAGSLAAAIFRRAVLLCRASLYPGLHTIIAPSAAGGAGAECAWCWRRHRARRCLWYGPPARTALAARSWRKVRGRRYLCACCPPRAADSPDPPDPPAPPAAPPALDDSGWYGKGYRKGRRRRR